MRDSEIKDSDEKVTEDGTASGNSNPSEDKKGSPKRKGAISKMYDKKKKSSKDNKFKEELLGTPT